MSYSKKRNVKELEEEDEFDSHDELEDSPPKKRAKSGKEAIPTGKSVAASAPTSNPTVVWEHDEELTTYNVNGRDVPIPKNRPVRVYADGIYDLFHMGHARSLLQAKSLFPNTCLVVGVCGDEITHKLKGRTVMNEKERVEAVSHCRYVDEVIPLAPWIITPEYMRKHKIDYVSHGEDLSVDENGNDVYQGIKDLGRFLVIKRTDGISTSDLILRIVKDYDKYVRRNLQRGYSYKEMNVGWAKRQEIKFDTQVEKLKKNYEEIKEDVIDSLVNNRLILDFKKWRDTSEEMLKDFVVKFKRGPKPISDRPRGLESPESPQDDDRYAHLFVGEEEEAEDLN